MSGPTDWGDEYPSERPPIRHVRSRASRVAQVLVAFGAMILLAGAGVALPIVAARWASAPYPIAVFQRPLIEIVVQGVPERTMTPSAVATPTALPSPTSVATPTELPSAAIPEDVVPTPTEAEPESAEP